MNTCPSVAPEDLERPCKQLGVSIDVSRLFVCPEQLKDLLLKEQLVEIKPESETIPENEPPTVGIINDMLKASSTIIAGLVEGAGTITAAERPEKLTLFKNWAHLQRPLKQLRRSSAL